MRSDQSPWTSIPLIFTFFPSSLLSYSPVSSYISLSSDVLSTFIFSSVLHFSSSPTPPSSFHPAHQGSLSLFILSSFLSTLRWRRCTLSTYRKGNLKSHVALTTPLEENSRKERALLQTGTSGELVEDIRLHPWQQISVVSTTSALPSAPPTLHPHHHIRSSRAAGGATSCNIFKA